MTSTDGEVVTVGPPVRGVRSIPPLALAPGLLLNGAAVVMTVFAIQRGSERTGDLGTLLPIAFGWGLLLLVWLFRFVAALGEGTLAVRDIGRWALAPALVVAVAIAVFSGAALGARFAASAGALDAAADAALAGGPVGAGWIGLYPVESVVASDASVRVAVTGQLALVRDAPPDESSAVVWHEPVFGRWSVEHTSIGMPD